MGGNALQHLCTTRRYFANEYHSLCDEVVTKLQILYPHRRIAVLPAYREKMSFGDMDVLFESGGEKVDPDVRQNVVQNFNSAGSKTNGNCLSFEYKEFQIDLIRMPATTFDTALTYYSWNDLGNFMGRVAYRMGVKYGHRGLSMVFRDGNYQFAEEIVSRNLPAVFTFLGYDYGRFSEGFDTLKEIYEFAASSPYFNKTIFAYENRNHRAKTRDRKRNSYQGFLEWMEDRDALPAFPWGHKTDERGGRTYDEAFLYRLFYFFPDFRATYYQRWEELERRKNFKTIFNGANVCAWTGLYDKDLGMFLQRIRQEAGDGFQEWVLKVGEEGVKTWVQSQYQAFTSM